MYSTFKQDALHCWRDVVLEDLQSSDQGTQKMNISTMHKSKENIKPVSKERGCRLSSYVSFVISFLAVTYFILTSSETQVALIKPLS